jgi:hypothetical protein
MDANSRNIDSSHHHDRTHGLSAEETLHLADCELPGDHAGSCDQAPLHTGGRRETPPARDTQGSTPFVVRVGLEAARSAATRSGKQSGVAIDRDAFYDCFGIYPDDLRRSFATALELALRPVELHTRRRG